MVLPTMEPLNLQTHPKLLDFIPISISPHAPPNPTPQHGVFTKQNLNTLISYCKTWITDPMNTPILVWLLAVGATLVFLLLLITGLLNNTIPTVSQRNEWIETANQITNALFTLMCLYQQPRLAHHFARLCRWGPEDVVELRSVYCMSWRKRKHERVHFGVVLALLHLTCFVQYGLCGLYWGWSMSRRSGVSVGVCIGVGIAAPLVAAAYVVVGPLGWREEEVLSSVDVKNNLSDPSLEEWTGGLFDCRSDTKAFFLSFFCTFCTFGWNMQRLGLGNKYVHTATFILLCTAPIIVFCITAGRIHNNLVRDMSKISGIILCFLGLLYGGLWRTRIRQRLQLAHNISFFGYGSVVADSMRWLFCCTCALAQEVRTGNLIMDHERKVGGEVLGEFGGDEELMVVKGWSCGRENAVVVPIPIVIDREQS